MVVNKLRDRYRVDLVGLQAACEANYARLMRLLPDMRNEPAARRIAVTHGDQMLGVLALEVLQLPVHHHPAGAPGTQPAVAAGAATGSAGLPRCAHGRSDQRRTCTALSWHLSLPERRDAPAG
jgi:hypothetical protein